MSHAELTLGEIGVAGEARPYGFRTKKLVMWLFIIADAATFGAILFAYGYVRVGSADWSRPFTFVPTIRNGIVMTFVLLTSSLTMLRAVRAAMAGRVGMAVRWLGATILLGVAFAGLHLREWFAMIAEGWTLTRNPLGGAPLFGAAFFWNHWSPPPPRHSRGCRHLCGHDSVSARPPGRQLHRDDGTLLALR